MENKFGNYLGLDLKKAPIREVEEKDINSEILRMQEESTQRANKEGKSELGDIVNIDFEGFVDGVAFQGGKGEQYDLELGSGTFIPGFEDQLVGYEKGAEVDVNVKFPENYQAENLKGKEAVFKCKINDIKTNVKPELNDEFAKNYGLESFAKLKDAVKNKLTYQYKSQAVSAYVEKVMDEVINNSTIEINDEELKSRVEDMTKYYEDSIAQYGMKIEQYLQVVGMTKEAFDERLKSDAAKSLKIDIIYNYIGENEKIECSNEELEREVQYLKQYYNLSNDQLETFRKEKLNDIKKEVIRQKVTTLLYEKNN